MPLSPAVERLTSSRLAFYYSYAMLDRSFARSLRGGRRLTKQDLRMFLEEAVREFELDRLCSSSGSGNPSLLGWRSESHKSLQEGAA